ncbi:MAG TPA: APC family permease [Catenuloplanes sp.]|jgi:amino acid transporter
MSANGPTGTVSNVSRALARGRLGVPAIVFFTMSAAAPLMVVAGASTTAYAVTGVTALPVAFLAVAVALAIFSVGYVAMARQITNAGAFYTYVARGLGRIPGVAAAFVAVLAYNALQIALYGGFGVLASGLLEEKFQLKVAWWLCALAAALAVAGLGVLRVDLNGKVLAVLLSAEILLLVIYSVFNLANPAGGSVDFSPLAPTGLFSAGIGAALVLAVTGFTGFEGAAIFSEEAKDPRRTVPMATFVTIAIVAVLYAGASWAMSVATGVDRIVQVSREESVFTLIGLAGQNINATFADIGSVLLVTSLFAGLLAFHNAVARYLFALGREGVLPRALGRTSRRTGSPKIGSLVQSGLAILVLLIYLALGLDPLVQLFFWVGMLGGFGVLLLITGTSLAVIAYFVKNPAGENTWTRLVAPALAALALGTISIVALVNFDTLLGVPASDPRRWILPALYLLAIVLGVAWGAVLRSSRPGVYASIGLGANAATGRTAADLDPGPAVPASIGGGR